MQSHLDCIPCLFAQAIRAARHAGLDETDTRQLLDEVAENVPSFDMSIPPPRNARMLYGRVAELAGTNDPFAAAKRRHTELALGLLPLLRRLMAEADDELDRAARIAAAGNILDLGAASEIEGIEQVVRRAVERQHQRWEIDALRGRLEHAREVLVLGDNAGETVFDRVLLETLGRLYPQASLSYSVRSAPIINDATVEDAAAAGLHEVATVLSTGCHAPGVLLDEVSDEFRQLFLGACVVISKGQGNFETLSDAPRELFFILTVKCRVVAEHLDLPQGASVLTMSA